MNKLGMSLEDLYMFATVKHLEISSLKTSKVFDDFNSDKIKNEFLEANLKLAREEAILNTVALMIETNNNLILKQLKELGFLNQE